VTANPELRYGRVMPWVLIIVGLALALYAIGVRADRETASVVQVQERAQPGTRAARESGELEVTKRTTTNAQMSDTLFGTLIGIATLLVAIGAFYSRVRNVTVAGHTIELGGPSEAQAIADAVTERLAEELRESGRGQLPVESAIELAGRAAAASAKAQQQAVQARVTASGAEAQAQLEAPQAIETLRVAPGSPLSRELVEQIAAEALESSDGGD
jgi:hypothetical protein